MRHILKELCSNAYFMMQRNLFMCNTNKVKIFSSIGGVSDRWSPRVRKQTLEINCFQNSIEKKKKKNQKHFEGTMRELNREEVHKFYYCEGQYSDGSNHGRCFVSVTQKEKLRNVNIELQSASFKNSINRRKTKQFSL